MSSLDDISILKRFGNLPVPFGALREQYRDYSAPAKKIAQLCSQGLLIRVKRGLYVVSDQIIGVRPSGYLLANHVYGPSYVSLETAMEFYGMIPEAVYSFESMTTGHPKEYSTPYGEFRYHRLPKNYFSLGVRMESTADRYRFLIASPEKALCDHFVSTRGLQIRSRSSLLSYLFDFMRVDEEALIKLDATLVHECSLAGPKKETLHFLEEAIRWIQSSVT
ncbi:MAG: hypothetical protein LBK67_07145 [Coriobacteriales bacterium]|jgi:hypothetical protein|nr:hypothetical protein [Coriobacteriales bacterium]